MRRLYPDGFWPRGPSAFPGSRVCLPWACLPAEWKIHRDRSTKHLLRQALAAELPKEIVYRPKQKLSVGAASSNVIAEVAECEITDMKFQSEMGCLFARWDYELPNKEAIYYYRILRKNLEDHWIFQTMGHSRIL